MEKYRTTVDIVGKYSRYSMEILWIYKGNSMNITLNTVDIVWKYYGYMREILWI